jgi:hypothetical protein
VHLKSLGDELVLLKRKFSLNSLGKTLKVPRLHFLVGQLQVRGVQMNLVSVTTISDHQLLKTKTSEKLPK